MIITCVRTQRPLWSWSVPPAPTLGTVQDTSVGKRLHSDGCHVEVTEVTETTDWRYLHMGFLRPPATLRLSWAEWL